MFMLSQQPQAVQRSSSSSLAAGSHSRGSAETTSGLGGATASGGPKPSAGRMRPSAPILPSDLAGAWAVPSHLSDKRTSPSPTDGVPKIGRGSSCGDLRVAGEPLATISLEDENRALREELARCQIDASHRRSMAAIAGGGFRGLTAQSRLCACDQLKAKLGRVMAELQEARCEARAGQSLILPDLVDSQVQTDPCPSMDRKPEVPVCQTIFVEASVQTAAPAPTSDVGNQTEARKVCSQQVQVGPGRQAPSVDVATETVVNLADSSAQASPSTREAAVQALQTPQGPPKERPRSIEAGAQTLPRSTADAGAQTAKAPPLAITTAASSQTDPPPPRLDTSTQAGDFDDMRRMSRPLTREFEVQTLADFSFGDRASSASQTARPSTSTMATQASPGRGTDRATQVEDHEARRREAVLKTQLSEIEAHASNTAVQNLALEDELQKEREGMEVWRSLAQRQTLGQMNVTILCPRAECTVNGQRIEIDSWNPVKIREEFEREVLPRFARIFVEEPTPGVASKARLRPEAVERTMQEFADVFREKLAAMLSAPNAAAAAAATAAHSRVGIKAGR